MIEVIQDVLPPHQLHLTQTKLLGPHWQFGFVSTDRNKPIWNFNKDECVSVVNNLMKHPKLKGFILHDYHVNGQTALLDAAFHKDSAHGVTHAFVFFPYEWNYQWGGRLHVRTPDGMQVVTPYENMGVLFDADYPHYGESPSLDGSARLRVSVGLKLILPSA